MLGGWEHHGRRRRRLPRFVVFAGLVLALTATTAFAAAVRPAVIDDASGDVAGALDLQRVSLHRSRDGRLRAILTFVGTVSPRSLLAASGPPGSACLRVWTDPDADPRSMRPDRLVCVTARSQDELRGGVFEQRDGRLPRRVATSAARTNRSGRSFVVRITQSSLGRPASIRFAAETAPPGCERIACIDTAPEAGRVRSFRLR